MKQTYVRGLLLLFTTVLGVAQLSAEPSQEAAGISIEMDGKEVVQIPHTMTECFEWISALNAPLPVELEAVCSSVAHNQLNVVRDLVLDSLDQGIALIETVTFENGTEELLARREAILESLYSYQEHLNTSSTIKRGLNTNGRFLNANITNGLTANWGTFATNLTVGGNLIVSGTIQSTSGGTYVTGPSSSTNRAIAIWGDTVGQSLLNSTPTVNTDGRIQNVTDPTLDQDASTKLYTDTVARLHGKAAVKGASAASYDGGGQPSGTTDPIDTSVTLTAGDRILLKNQTNGVFNGIWVVAAGNWTRPSDFATGSSAASDFVTAQEGTDNADTSWICTNNPPNDIVDTDALVWVAFAAGGMSGPISSTDNAIARFDGTDGQTLQNSGVIIDDSDNMTGVTSIISPSINTTAGTVTTFGNATGTAAINGLAINLTGNTNIFGEANINTIGSTDTNLNSASNTGIITIGNFGTSGNVNLNSAATIELKGATAIKINESAAGAVTIGNDTVGGIVTLATASTATNAIDINSDGGVDIDAAGIVAIDSTAGVINIGTQDIDQNVNIGTDGVRTVTVGSVNGAAGTVIQAGTGNLSLTKSGITANWPTAAGTSGQFLSTNGGTPQTLSWGSAAGFTGSSTVNNVPIFSNTTGTIKQPTTVATLSATTVSINPSGTGTTNIGAGTNTGAVTIGSGTGNQGITLTASGTGKILLLGKGSTADDVKIFAQSGGVEIKSGRSKDIKIWTDTGNGPANAGKVDIIGGLGASSGGDGGAVTMTGGASGKNSETGGSVAISSGAAGGADGSAGGAGSVNINVGDPLASGAEGTINIGTTNDTGKIQVGKSVTGTTEVELNGVLVDINAGSGGYSLTSAGTGPGAITLSATAGGISIGADDFDQVVNLGTDGARTVTVGSVNTTATTVLQSGSGGITLNGGAALSWPTDAGTNNYVLTTNGTDTLTWAAASGVTASGSTIANGIAIWTDNTATQIASTTAATLTAAGAITGLTSISSLSGTKTFVGTTNINATGIAEVNIGTGTTATDHAINIGAAIAGNGATVNIHSAKNEAVNIAVGGANEGDVNIGSSSYIKDIVIQTTVGGIIDIESASILALNNNVNGLIRINTGTAGSTHIGGTTAAAATGIVLISSNNATPGTISINDNGVNALTTIGTGTATGSVGIGGSSNAVNIGTGTTAAVAIKGVVSINAGNAGAATNIGTGGTTGTVTIGGGGVAQAVTISGGNNTAAVAETLNLGTGGVNNGSGGKVVNILSGALTTGTQTVNIATGAWTAGNQSINIGDTGGNTSLEIYGPLVATGAPGETVSINASGARWQRQTSSRRYKKDINAMKGTDTEWIYKLQGMKYRYINDPSVECYGYIAEEVDLVNKNMVIYNAEGKPESLRYMFAIPAITEEMKKHQAELIKSDLRIAGLEAELATMKLYFTALQEQVSKRLGSAPVA